MIASASLYEWTPSLTVAWRRLFGWIGRCAGVPLTHVSDSSLTLEALWSRDDLGCAFMCGYPYVHSKPRPALLAAPVPSPGRFGGRPVYVTDFVVRADSPYRTLEDTFDGRIAYSAEHSHSGYNAARFHLLRYRSLDRSSLFAEVKGPYGRQRAVIEAVLCSDADVAPIDGFAHDLLARHEPATATRLRVVATTEPAPSPPLVASPTIAAGDRERVTEALATAHQVKEASSLMRDLLLLRFERVTASSFDVLHDWERAAAAAGYPTLS